WWVSGVSPSSGERLRTLRRSRRQTPLGSRRNAGHQPSSIGPFPTVERPIEGLFVAVEGLVYAFDGSADGNSREPPANAVCTIVIGGLDLGYTNPNQVKRPTNRPTMR